MNNTAVLNRVFTRKVISELVETGGNETYESVVRRYVNDPDGKNHGEIISEIYRYLEKSKRNEYFYQNTLLNKLLVGKHSVNTSTALSQLRIARSIADFVFINGKGVVYEIKSECDNFERLEQQLRDYYKAFSYVCVVTAARDIKKIRQTLSSFKTIGEYVGIYALTDNDTQSKIHNKEPIRYNGFLEHTYIFKLLRKREYENVLTAYFDEFPKTEPVFHYRACIEKFHQIPIIEAQELALIELKKRNKITKTDLACVPKELKSVVYFSDVSKKIGQLSNVLQTAYKG